MRPGAESQPGGQGLHWWDVRRRRGGRGCIGRGGRGGRRKGGGQGGPRPAQHRPQSGRAVVLQVVGEPRTGDQLGWLAGVCVCVCMTSPPPGDKSPRFTCVSLTNSSVAHPPLAAQTPVEKFRCLEEGQRKKKQDGDTWQSKKSGGESVDTSQWSAK